MFTLVVCVNAFHSTYYKLQSRTKVIEQTLSANFFALFQHGRVAYTLNVFHGIDTYLVLDRFIDFRLCNDIKSNKITPKMKIKWRF
jgi:hypothetical protein